MNRNLDMIIETVERLKKGVEEDRLSLEEEKKAGLKEWAIDSDDLMNKSYLYGYLSGRFHVSFDLEDTFTLLQDCQSTLFFIRCGVSEGGFFDEDIMHAINLVENNLRKVVKEVGKQLNLE